MDQSFQFLGLVNYLNQFKIPLFVCYVMLLVTYSLRALVVLLTLLGATVVEYAVWIVNIYLVIDTEVTVPFTLSPAWILSVMTLILLENKRKIGDTLTWVYFTCIVNSFIVIVIASFCSLCFQHLIPSWIFYALFRTLSTHKGYPVRIAYFSGAIIVLWRVVLYI